MSKTKKSYFFQKSENSHQRFALMKCQQRSSTKYYIHVTDVIFG